MNSKYASLLASILALLSLLFVGRMSHLDTKKAAIPQVVPDVNFALGGDRSAHTQENSASSDLPHSIQNLIQHAKLMDEKVYDHAIGGSSKLLQARFQYPLLQYDYRPKNGHTKQEVYVADHVLVSLAPNCKDILTTWCTDNNAYIRKELREGRIFLVASNQVQLDTAKTLQLSLVNALGDLPSFMVCRDSLAYSTATPNDPEYDRLWGMDGANTSEGLDLDMNASEAWDLTTGDSKVVVAVVDTGVDVYHEDLRENIWVNKGEVPGNGIDDDQNGYIDDIFGWDFVSDTGYITDIHGHGTHVAGTVGAVGNNGVGVVGASQNVSIMAIRALSSDGLGLSSSIIEAFYYLSLIHI